MSDPTPTPEALPPMDEYRAALAADPTPAQIEAAARAIRAYHHPVTLPDDEVGHSWLDQARAALTAAAQADERAVSAAVSAPDVEHPEVRDFRRSQPAPRTVSAERVDHAARALLDHDHEHWSQAARDGLWSANEAIGVQDEYRGQVAAVLNALQIPHAGPHFEGITQEAPRA